MLRRAALTAQQWHDRRASAAFINNSPLLLSPPLLPGACRGAVVHVIGDLVQSIGVAVAGALIWAHQVRAHGWLAHRADGCSSADVHPAPAAWKRAGGGSAGLCRRQLPQAAPRRAMPSALLPSCRPSRSLVRALSVSPSSPLPSIPSRLPFAAGRPALVHCRPHLHLPLCHPGESFLHRDLWLCLWLCLLSVAHMRIEAGTGSCWAPLCQSPMRSSRAGRRGQAPSCSSPPETPSHAAARSSIVPSTAHPCLGP